MVEKDGKCVHKDQCECASMNGTVYQQGFKFKDDEKCEEW